MMDYVSLYQAMLQQNMMDKVSSYRALFHHLLVYQGLVCQARENQTMLYLVKV